MRTQNFPVTAADQNYHRVRPIFVSDFFYSDLLVLNEMSALTTFILDQMGDNVGFPLLN